MRFNNQKGILMQHLRSQELFQQAQILIPGGVNSPVRCARAVGSSPLFIAAADGCRIQDEDGNIYIDYVSSWGPLIAGHAHPEVVAAVRDTVTRGTSYGIPCRLEIELARKVVELMPAVEMVRMVNSGTEATMSAIRLARGCTGRKKLIKFSGCYHGHHDCMLAQAGSGVLTLGLPGCPGVPEEVVRHTICLPYNDLAAVATVIGELGPEVAAIIVEPVAANMGVVLPEPGFLEGLRNLCDRSGALLIFDEVITGFRVAPGGAQQRFGVRPDLTCLGKIIGGGLPVGAYGGRRDIMERVAPVGDVYQAGTLSGNPLAMAAGLKTLELLGQDGVYPLLAANLEYLTRGLAEAARDAGVPTTINQIASMGCSFFTPGPVRNFAQTQQSDTRAYGIFFREMLDRGVYLAPSQFEALFIGLAHGRGELDYTIEAARGAFKAVREQE